MEIKTIKAEIKIRYAAPRDATLLSRLGRETFYDTFADHPRNSLENVMAYIEEAFSLEKIESELADPKAIFLIAESEGEAYGYTKLLIDSYEPAIIASRPIELVRLYASKNFIGKGIGAALMRRCLDEAAYLERDVIWLGVWEYNKRARDFYNRWKFIPVGSHLFQLGADAQTDLLMQRAINL
ncbi:MAG: GNAT family N-acetyltransferase [Acidobacteriota bacterium]